MASIGNLDVNINTSGVASGVADLNKLTAAGGRAESAVEALADATQALGKAAPAAGAAAKALKDVGNAAAGAGGAAQTLNNALSGTGAAAQKAAGNFGTFAAGQKLSAYQTQQLSFQLNDLFVQIASGQSPLTALIQQGSQLNGTFGGIGGTLRALASVFTVTNVAIAAAVVAVGGLGFAYYKGSQQSDDFRKAVLLTGNAAGVTEGQFNSLAETIAASTRTTVGSTRDTLQALVESGRFTGQTLEAAAAATQGLAKITGESTDKIAASFVKGSQSVGTFAQNLNDQYNFLSATQLDYIKTLADQGREQEALSKTFEALNARIGTVGSSTGILGGIFNKVKTDALNLADAIASIGRADTTEGTIAKLEKQLAGLGKASANPALAATQELRTQLQGQLDTLRQTAKEDQARASASAQRVQSERAATAFLELQDKYGNAAARRDKERAVVLEKAKAAGKDVNSAEVKSLLAEVDRRNKDPKAAGGGAGKARTDAAAAAREALEDIKAAGQAQLDEFQSQDRILEANRAALLIRDKAYYDEKVRIATAGINAQIATLQKENQFLGSRTLTGADDSDRDRQITQNEAKIASLRAQRITQVKVLRIQEQAAAQQTVNATADARAAAEQYLAVQQRGQDLTLRGLALSDREQQAIQAVAAIRERYESQRQSLAGDLRRNQITQERYDSELATINEFQTKAIASYTSYYDRTVQLAGDAGIGASRAVANYFDGAANVAKQTEDLLTTTFSGLEDALVTFVSTGKLNFKSLATSIIADIARIQIKAAAVSLFKDTNILGSIGGAFNPDGGLGSVVSSLFGGGRAAGGPVDAGKLYQVNERGPELLNVAGKQYLMMGGQSGSVTPNGGGAGSGGVNIVNQTQGRIDQAHVTRMDDGQMAIVLQQAEDRIIAGLRDPNGRANGAVQASFNVQPKR